jgi:hypothetical protein
MLFEALHLIFTQDVPLASQRHRKNVRLRHLPHHAEKQGMRLFKLKRRGWFKRKWTLNVQWISMVDICLKHLQLTSTTSMDRTTTSPSRFETFAVLSSRSSWCNRGFRRDAQMESTARLVKTTWNQHKFLTIKVPRLIND